MGEVLGELLPLGVGVAISPVPIIAVILMLLVFLGGAQWRQAPPFGTHPPLPSWMVTINEISAAKALGLGFLLAAVNPKNLLLCVAAGVTIAGSGLGGGQEGFAIAVFTVFAGSTVLVPVLGYAVAEHRMRRPLDQLKTWLQDNNATVMSVLLLVIGMVLVGKGFGGLT